jgi:undecaprenyl-diphosphatase
VHALSAALLGVVQGLTEFLPVSSTAHLLLAGRWLRYDDPGGVFTVTIQFGSVLAIIWLYRHKIAAVLAGLPSDPAARRFAIMIAAAFLPAALAGWKLSGFVKSVLYASPGVIAAAFIIGGLVMLVVERFRPAPVVFQADQTPIGRAVAIGIGQTLALVPGVSRSGATIVSGLVAGLDRPAAAEFSFFLAIPTLGAACAHDLWDVRHALTGARAGDIAIGVVAAFIASVLVVRPFMSFVGRSGFAPFAWYRIAAGVVLLGAMALGRLLMASLVPWLRRRFITGFFVTVPLVVSVVAIVWVVQFADGMTTGLGERVIGRHVPGLGLIATAVVILVIGAIATNVFGRRLLLRGESLLLQVPLFRTIYAPVKQLISAFSPDNEFGFKRVVLVENPDRGSVLGFLTKEFTIDRGPGPGAAPGGLRADQSSLPGRHPDLPARSGGSFRICRCRKASGCF